MGDQGQGVRVPQCSRLTPRLAAQRQPQGSSAEKHEAGISDPSQIRTHTERFSLTRGAKRRTHWFSERRPGASRTFKQRSPGVLVPPPLVTKDRRGAQNRGLDVCVCAGAKDKAAQDERERPRNACSTERSNYKDRLQASQVALVVKNPPADAGDAGSIPESGRPPEGGHGNPLQYSCLENPKDTGAWRTTVHRVAKNRT